MGVAVCCVISPGCQSQTRLRERLVCHRCLGLSALQIPINLMQMSKSKRGNTDKLTSAWFSALPHAELCFCTSVAKCSYYAFYCRLFLVICKDIYDWVIFRSYNSAPHVRRLNVFWPPYWQAQESHKWIAPAKLSNCWELIKHYICNQDTWSLPRTRQMFFTTARLITSTSSTQALTVSSVQPFTL